MDTRALRGGPALRVSDDWAASLGAGTDSSRRVSLSLSGTSEQALEGGSGTWRTLAALRLRPSNRLLLSANARLTEAIDDVQYVATARASDGPSRVLGWIDQEVWALTFRANLTLTPELTVHYYGGPFIATGCDANFRKATHTLTPPYEDRLYRYADSEIAHDWEVSSYRVTEGSGGPGATYAFSNPDFSFRQFRSNLVVRCEYKPGSSLCVVWSQGRTDNEAAWEGSFRGNRAELWRAQPDNVVLVKLSYWFSL